MRALTGLALSLLLFTLAVVALYVSGYGDFDAWGVPVVPSPPLEREQRRVDHLREELDVCQGRIRARYRVCAALREGRLTLAEAAARFRALDAHIPDFLRPLYAHYPGQSEGERCCRKVIDYLEAASPAWPDASNDAELRAVQARLTAALQALLDGAGKALVRNQT